MIALLFESSLPDAMCNGMLIDQSVEPEANVLNLRYGTYFQKCILCIWALDASMQNLPS